MPTALDVARHLIRLGAAEEEPDYLSPLRLQKLLYYVQGWHLGAFERPLFSERIEAWKYGPVVPSVYQAFKSYDDQGIRPSAEEEPSYLSRADRAFIDSVWAGYKQFSAIGLYEKTHSEPPWRNARGNLPAGAPSNAEIPQEELRKFFRPLTEERLVPGLPPEEAYAALEQFERGEGRPAKEVFARIRAR